ncbi:hypothetical protein LJB83_00680 [Clostridia bacterium OttesenSCG-928-F22]|nr:hypothetical protein [Clostridia bacterium OttesenSCG-928-F22]
MQNDNNPALDSQRMMTKLKEDEFPRNDFQQFLDEDIRSFFDELLESTGQQKSDIIKKTNIDRTYGYQIFSGMRIAERDYYIRIAIAMSLDLRTTQRMLAVTKSSGLHPLIMRDAAIIFAINHQYDYDTTYDFMLELGLEPLEKDI